MTEPAAKPAGTTQANEPAPGAWRALALLFLIYSCHYLDRSIVGVVVEPVRKEFGLSDSQIGLLTGLVYGIAFCVAGLPLGLLVDRVSRKRLLAGMLVAWSGLTALSGLAQNYAQMVWARAAVGAAEAGASPAAMSLISDFFPPSRRATATGLFFLSTSFGMAISNGFGGLITAEWGWRAAFFVAGVPGLILAAMLMLLVKEPPRGRFEAPTDHVARTGFGEALRVILADRRLLCVMLGLIVMAFCAAAKAAFVVAFLMRVHGLDVREAGALVALGAGLFGALGTLSGGLIADRLARRSASGPVWLIVTGATLTGIFGLAYTLAPPLAAAVAFLLIGQFVGTLHMGPAYALSATAAPPAVRGTAIAILQVGANLVGYGLGPFVAGVLSDFFAGGDSLRWSLATISCFYLLAALSFAVAARSPPPVLQGLGLKTVSAKSP